jgi:hypothetical protein
LKFKRYVLSHVSNDGTRLIHTPFTLVNLSTKTYYHR